MTYAIIETGGKQMRVEPGRFYDVELLHVEPDAPYTIDKVLLVQQGDEISIGQPFVTGAVVNGTIIRHFRGRKIIVYKMRPKKKTRKKRGHRQEITRLMIDSISLDGKIIAGEAVASPEVVLASPEVVDVVDTAAATPAVEVEVATPEVEATEVATPEVEATEVEATEVEATEVDATEVDTTEVDATEVDATEVDATETPKKKKKK